MLLLVTSKELADHYNPASTFPGAFEVSRLPPDAQVGHTAALLRLVTLIKIKIWKGGSYQLHWARRTVPFPMNNVAILSRSIYTSQDPGFFHILGELLDAQIVSKGTLRSSPFCSDRMKEGALWPRQDKPLQMQQVHKSSSVQLQDVWVTSPSPL